MLGDSRSVVPEVQSAREVPALELILPWRCWELLPASCIPAERTGAPGISPFRKPSLARDYAARLEFGIGPVCEIDRDSGGQVTDPVFFCLG